MNRTIIIVLLVLLASVVGVGFYRGWFFFVLSKPPTDPGSNRVNVNLTVDPDKMKADAEAVKEKTTELTGQATPSASEPADQAKNSK